MGGRGNRLVKRDLHRRVERLQGRPSCQDPHGQLVSELAHALLGMPGQLEQDSQEPTPEGTVNHRHQFPYE